MKWTDACIQCSIKIYLLHECSLWSYALQFLSSGAIYIRITQAACCKIQIYPISYLLGTSGDVT